MEKCRTKYPEEAPEDVNGIEQVIVIRFVDQKVGLIQDSMIGEYQGTLKPLANIIVN